MVQDEIMRDLRAIRERRAMGHKYDVRALYEEAKGHEQRSSRRVVRLKPRRLQEAAEKSV